MSFLDALAIGLAAWRMASLLTREDGPFDVFARLRNLFLTDGEQKGMSLLFSCMWCMSVWTGIAAYLLWSVWHPSVIILSASTVSVLIERVLGNE